MSRSENNARHIIEAYFGGTMEDEVLASFQPCELRGGDWLFRQGDAGDSLYLLLRGRLQAWAEAAEEGGERRLLGEVLPGDSVGEAGLLAGSPRSAGIRANRDSLLVRLEKADFEALASRHPALVMKLASNVAMLMQRNLAGATGGQRGYHTITLQVLHNSPLLDCAIKQLLESLPGMFGDPGAVRVLEPSMLEQAGAPQGLSAEQDSIPEDLKQWLSEQENDYGLVIYRCAAENDAWSRFALRQADLALLLADAAQTPDLTGLEQSFSDAEVAPVGKRALLLVHTGERIEGTARWLAPREPDFHLHLRSNPEGGQARASGDPQPLFKARDLQRVLRILTGRAVGLVLGAGAVRGLSELGVYKAMVEAGVPVDWVGGSSIGSIVAGAIAHDWTPEHAIKVARDAFVGGKPFSDYTLPIVSLIRGRRMIRLLRAQIDVAIEDLPLPFFCVSSKLDRGEVHLHLHGSLVEAIRASAALPGVLPPAVVDSELVVDGAVLNNLPVDIMQQQPVNSIIAVDVSFRDTRKVDYTQTPSSWAVLRGRLLPFSKRYRVPGLATLILRSTEIGTLVQAREHGKRADLLLTPPVRQFGMTDVKAFDPIVEAGYQHARQMLAEWLAGGGLRPEDLTPEADRLRD